MADEPQGGLDRRDLLAASLATASALAATVGGAGAADAQGTPAPAAGPAPRPPGGTVFTGDVIQGKRVISALDVRDLEPGRKHLLYFQGVQTVTGQHWYVSVMVAKGARPGKRILLTSGVHGDEISPMHTLQTVMNQLDPAQMSGTVTAVFDVSRPAIEGMARRWPNSGRGIDLIDLNREWPGQENGFGAPARHAALLFEGLFRPNADYAIDFHTSATGMDMTALHVARMDLPEVRAMAELFPITHIFDNAAYPGILPNALIEAGIPAFTPEIGAPRILDLEMIPLFVEGTMNVLKHHGVIERPAGPHRAGYGRLRRQPRASRREHPWRVRRAPGQAERQGRSRAEGRDPAQRLRRGRGGVRQPRRRRRRGAAHRCHRRARHPPDVRPP